MRTLDSDKKENIKICYVKTLENSGLSDNYLIGMEFKKECDYIKQILLIISIVFFFLTFVGAIYILTSNGTANAGYAVIPMVIVLACLASYRTYKDKEK